MRWFSWRAGGLAGAIALGMCAAPAAAAAAADGGLAASAASLAAGQFAWDAGDQAVPGLVNIVVSIPLQQLFVYRDGQLVAVSTVSTGKDGHETPVGEFTILQKQVDHRSNKYNDAPMPYMERITWDGVAIHGGHNPGYPASHGCIRVPLAFAKKLFSITRLGARVSVVDDTIVPGMPDGFAAGPAVPAPLAVAIAADSEAAATRAANLSQVY